MKPKKSFARFLLSLQLCFLQTVSTASFIVQNGQPQADIVVAPDPPRMTALAARELRDYIAKISGANLAIVTSPGAGVPNHLYVGRSSFTDALGLDTSGLPYDSFRIRCGNGWVAFMGYDEDYQPTGPFAVSNNDVPRMNAEWDQLTGADWNNPYTGLYRRRSTRLGYWELDKRGSLNAVYEFLRELGVRWFFPGDLGEEIPVMTDILLPDTDREVHPDFPVRYLYQYYNQFWTHKEAEILWQLRLGLNGGDECLGPDMPVHGLLPILARPSMQEAHPEYYALRRGVRRTNPPAPCLSSPGFFSETIAYARAVSDIHNPPTIGIWPTDGYVDLCECSLCEGKDTPERGYYGRLSDYVWTFVNNVAGELLTTHPERKVLCGAYTAYQLPPLGIGTLHSNVTATICRWRSSFHDEEVFASYTNLVNSWLSVLPSGELYIYDYYLHSERDATRGVPVYYPRIIARDLGFLKGKSKGEFIEVQRNYETWNRDWHALAANHLNLYVTSRFYWDAEQDLDALLDDYYTRFYGPAAQEMQTFIEFCEEHWPVMRRNKQAMDRTFILYEAARSAAGDGKYGARVAMLEPFMRPLLELKDSLSDHYVAQNGQTPGHPYLSWETAASNLQTAISISGTGAVIRVGPGRYTLPHPAPDLGGPTVALIDRPLSIRAASQDPADTIIDGEGQNRCLAIRYPQRVTNEFLISGFTVTNGYALNAGGGLAISSGNQGLRIIVSNCLFTCNRVAYGEANSFFSHSGSYGGAIGNRETLPSYHMTLSDCTFRGNEALHGGAGSGIAGDGGAIFLRNNNTYPFEIYNCLFENNKAVSGAAIMNSYSDLRVHESVFRNNTAGLGDSGVAWNNSAAGGLYLSHSSSYFRNCLAYNNNSPGWAGFLFSSYRGDAVLENCTITDNHNNRSGGVGGVFARFENASFKIINCIVYGNSPSNWSVSYPQEGSYISNSCTTPLTGVPGGGNTSANPLFVDPAKRDYRLQRGSPCTNSGRNQPWMLPAKDLAGQLRLDSETGIVDMGCYETPGRTSLFLIR